MLQANRKGRARTIGLARGAEEVGRVAGGATEEAARDEVRE
jgi:hypothetical protein